jgi:hypothetical protein
VASEKTKVVEHLFFVLKGFNPEGGLADPVVTFDEIEAAIDATGANLKKNNLANFWKDITRSDPNRIWPTSVLDAGYSGTDAIGQGPGASFEFVRLPAGQQIAFALPLAPSAGAVAGPVALESISMPLATKAQGRKDENWLAQVGVRLRIIETHFALASPLNAREVTFLQTGVKLGRGEVDAAYSLVDDVGDQWLIAVEVKGRGERIHLPQLWRAALALFEAALAREQNVLGVIPVALKVIGDSRIHVVEFEAERGQGSAGTVVADSIIELRPTVTGIE